MIPTATPFSDLALSRRLERAEGYACLQFAKARRQAFPDCGSEWTQCGGAYAVFDGIDAPTTQSFGLGLFEDLTPSTLDVIERFFFDRGACVLHEISPHVGVPALDLLCARGYRPLEISNVVYRAVEAQVADLPDNKIPDNIRVRVTGAEEAELWNSISTRGWSHDHPELMDFLLQSSAISSAREGSVCFLAQLEGQPGAAGVLSIHEGVALFGGSATVPELRCRGLQSALLAERMRYAFDHGCDLAMMVAQVASNSQRNAERKGFRIAYTRTKWRLSS